MSIITVTPCYVRFLAWKHKSAGAGRTLRGAAAIDVATAVSISPTASTGYYSPTSRSAATTANFSSTTPAGNGKGKARAKASPGGVASGGVGGGGGGASFTVHHGVGARHGGKGAGVGGRSDVGRGLEGGGGNDEGGNAGAAGGEAPAGEEGPASDGRTATVGERAYSHCTRGFDFAVYVCVCVCPLGQLLCFALFGSLLEYFSAWSIATFTREDQSITRMCTVSKTGDGRHMNH